MILMKMIMKLKNKKLKMNLFLLIFKIEALLNSLHSKDISDCRIIKRKRIVTDYFQQHKHLGK